MNPHGDRMREGSAGANERVDRRRHLRARRRLKVTLPHCRAFTTDIGSGGFCTDVARVLPVGTRLEGMIEIGVRLVPFTGTIAWAAAGDAYIGLRGRMGILFSATMLELDVRR